MPHYPSGVTSRSQFGRPTTYAGIAMRSRTEAKYAQFLDRMGYQWEYEPRCYAGPQGQYLPDFHKIHRLPDGDLCDVFTEVKAAIPAAIQELQARMEVIWLSEPEALLEIAVLGPLIDDDVPDFQWLATPWHPWEMFDNRDAS